MKFVYNFVLINAVCVAIFVLFGTMAFTIPKEYIHENVLKSKAEFETMEIPTVYDCSYLNEPHWAAWISMAYSGDDSKSPLYNSINMYIPANGHSFGVHNIDEAINGGSIGYSYARYWHGAVSTLRCLLAVCSLNQILLFGQFLIWLLLIISFLLLYKKCRLLSVFYLISILISTFLVVTKSIFYMPDFLVLFIVTIITILFFLKANWKVFALWMSVVGSVTCFFDALVTPVLTIGFPLAVYIFIRKDYNWKCIIGVSFCWAISYLFSILSRWVLAYYICDINTFAYFTGEYQGQYNLHLPFIQYAKRISFIIIALFFFLVGLFYIKYLKKIKLDLNILVSYILIILIPIAFCIADWHPFTFHYWMTHRNWAVAYFAIMCCLYSLYYKEQANKRL